MTMQEGRWFQLLGPLCCKHRTLQGFLLALTISLPGLLMLGLFHYSLAPTVPVQMMRTDMSTSRKAELEARYDGRVKVASNACLRSPLGQIRRILMDNDNRLANCIVPKVGCTYWINIFRYLNNQTGDHRYSSPFDIPRWTTHYAPPLMNFRFNTSSPIKPQLADALRFMFVRDPYSRLWSAWIDKFLLPDFWFAQAVQMYKFIHRSSLTNSTVEQIRCVNNITFVQFLRYISQDRWLASPHLLDEHWCPYKHLCDPCLFRPQVIGKIETFIEDSSYILKSANLSWITRLPRNHSLTTVTRHSTADHSIQEMRMLTEYNLHLAQLQAGQLQNCASSGEIFRRLWLAFQYNGHLPASQAFPFSELQPHHRLTEQHFLSVAEKTYLVWTEQGKSLQSKQRQQLMIEAYKEVPTDIMMRLQRLYKTDFDSFDYQQAPAHLYHFR